MPVFEMVNGWAITIYLNDHLPIHFHAKKAGVSVRFYLDGTFEIEGHGKLSPADRNRLSCQIIIQLIPLTAFRT